MLNVLQILVSIAILIVALPLGYLLAWLTKEELVQGRIAFSLLMAVSPVAIIALLFLGLEINLKLAVISAFIFIFAVAAISMLKSYDKKFVKILK